MNNKCISCKHLYINPSSHYATNGRQNGKTIIAFNNAFKCKKIEENIGVYIYCDKIVPCLAYKEKEGD